MEETEDVRPVINSAKTVLSEIMNELKKHCPLLPYRNFMCLMRHIAVKEHRSSRHSILSIQNGAVKDCIGSNSKLDELGHLLCLLGFASNSEDRSYGVEDYDSSKVVLKAFTEMTFTDVFVHTGDPRARESLLPNSTANA
eukprot:m.126688 g.126688  ORF g.126688 m.126688 type:complete len:140 (+) comp37915_c0_seq12:1954-2373(+)